MGRRGKVRIVGGCWRGRRLPVPPVAGLRPTPERVRETLFAWLAPRIEGLACLDLFAGTGALGFEAVSRGAARAVLVERDPRLCRGLREQVAVFAAGQRLRIECADALSWLSRPRREGFDLVCLDPPFARYDLAERCCRLLVSRGLLAEGGLLYLESRRELQLPRQLQTLRSKQAGQVRYLLARFGAAPPPPRPVPEQVPAGRERAGCDRVNPGAQEKPRGKRVNKIAIYPGTFDPITLGHVDIAARASELFDRVVLAVAANAGESAAFSRQERVELARLALAEYRNVEVQPFDTLVTELASRLGARFLIRGLRAVSDFDYEFQMAAMNRCLAPELETLFLMPAERFNYLSSSVVREIAGLGGDVGNFVPEAVLRALQRRLAAAERPPGKLRSGGE